MEWRPKDLDEVMLTYSVTGAGGLLFPKPAPPQRADELWQTTCFEIFWGVKGQEHYFELNFSPSGRWAAYAFDGYRALPRCHPMAVDPQIEARREDDRYHLKVDVDVSTFPNRAAEIGLSAILEESDGTRSYWALAHPQGRPDFHDRSCFCLSLPATG